MSMLHATEALTLDCLALKLYLNGPKLLYTFLEQISLEAFAPVPLEPSLGSYQQAESCVRLPYMANRNPIKGPSDFHQAEVVDMKRVLASNMYKCSKYQWPRQGNMADLTR